MPRRPAEEPRDETVLFRLTKREYTVLRSVAHLEDATPNAYAHQLLVTHLAALATNPFVLADLENRAAYQAAAGVVTALPTATPDDKPQVKSPAPKSSKRKQ